jgi:hypothetical protein
MNETNLFSKNALFELCIDSIIPDELDAGGGVDVDKEFYVKVKCKNKEEVRHIIDVFEKKCNIERKRIVISA